MPFSPELVDLAIASVKRRVAVTGLMRYQTASAFPFHVEVSQIVTYGNPAQLPSFLSLRGIAPEATGDLASEDFVAGLRDACNLPPFYWDTCIFLAWLKNEEHRKPGQLEATKDCVERFERREILIMTSALTLAEIAPPAQLPAGAMALLEKAMQHPNFTTVSVDLSVGTMARELREYYAVRKAEFGGKTLTAPDAIHLATAILYKANEFHTFDEKDKARANSLGLLPLSGNVGGHDLKICIPPGNEQKILFS